MRRGWILIVRFAGDMTKFYTDVEPSAYPSKGVNSQLFCREKPKAYVILRRC